LKTKKGWIFQPERKEIMKTNIASSLFIVSAVAGAFLFSGCGTPAGYVDPNSSRLVTTVGQINIQDFSSAADAMVASLIDNLINPGQLKSGSPGEPALMAISRITNDTGQQFDTDLLVKKIRVNLLRTGKVQVTTTVGLNAAEDPLAAKLQVETGTKTRLPDYTLSGKIIQVRANAGSLSQSSFVFQLSLTSHGGIAVWEDEKTITKQGSKSSVGF
jgi:hypothetical protein